MDAPVCRPSIVLVDGASRGGFERALAPWAGCVGGVENGLELESLTAARTREGAWGLERVAAAAPHAVESNIAVRAHTHERGAVVAAKGARERRWRGRADGRRGAVGAAARTIDGHVL